MELVNKVDLRMAFDADHLIKRNGLYGGRSD